MSRPKRLPDRSYVGVAQYFLTFCVLERRPAFKEEAVVGDTLAQFQRTAGDERFEIRAYCFMPDHVHLLIKGTAATSDLRRFVKMSRQRSGYAYASNREAQLWQAGYFERVLRDDDDARTYARYIVSNPVRASLVKAAADYAFLGVTGWTLEELTNDEAKARSAPKITPGLKTRPTNVR